jgi:hypothetical protein
VGGLQTVRLLAAIRKSGHWSNGENWAACGLASFGNDVPESCRSWLVARMTADDDIADIRVDFLQLLVNTRYKGRGPPVNDQELVRRVQIGASPEEWASFKSYLGELPPEGAFVLLRVLGERLPLGIDVETAVNDASDVPGRIVAGAALMVRATRIRGMDTADRVEEQNWGSYFACRERAEQLLRYAVTSQPKNGLAAAWLMATAVDSDEEVKVQVSGFLDEATNVPISGYSKLLSANTEKWGGSHDAMWKVAREYAVVRWPWTRALIAKAHYEHWLYLDMMDERPEARKEAEAYFQDPAIRDELLSISNAISTTRSDDPYEAVYAHDVLAAVLAEAKMTRAAAEHLRQVGKFGDPALLTGGPWWRRSLIRVLKGLPPW